MTHGVLVSHDISAMRALNSCDKCIHPMLFSHNHVRCFYFTNSWNYSTTVFSQCILRIIRHFADFKITTLKQNVAHFTRSESLTLLLRDRPILMIIDVERLLIPNPIVKIITFENSCFDLWSNLFDSALVC